MDVKDLTFLGDADETIIEDIGILIKFMLSECAAKEQARVEMYRRFHDDLKMVFVE